MPFNQKPQKFNAKINSVTIGNGDKTVTIGGENSFPFYSFDAPTENAPKIGVEISDLGLDEFSEGVKAYYEGATTMADIAKKAAAIEGAEDSQELAVEDLKNIHLTDKDVVCGIAASGRTPYVIGGLQYARTLGCQTVSICCVHNGEISKYSHYPIEAITGAEVVTGSTRMKAGTAQKLVLNMLSTSVMIKRGKVYKNLMVDVQPTNEKLKIRAVNIVSQSLDCSEEESITLLTKCHYNVKIAILSGLTGKDEKECEEALLKNNGNISKTVKSNL